MKTWIGLTGGLSLLVAFAWWVGAQPAPVPLAATASLATSNWPKYRHDLWNTGRSATNGPRTNALKWLFTTGRAEKDGGIETDPVIGPDGTVYLGANNGILYGLDPDTGDIRWVFPTGSDAFGIYSTPAILKDGTLVFGAKDGKVYAVRPPAAGILGDLKWSVGLKTTIETSPAVGADGTVYIGADDWKLYAIAPPQGRAPAHQVDLPDPRRPDFFARRGAGRHHLRGLHGRQSLCPPGAGGG